MNVVKTSIDFGNKTVTLSINALNINIWEKSDQKRAYFEVVSDSKANPISKFYEILSGTTRDNLIEVSGRKFAYSYGFCDSKKKQAAADEAAKHLAEQLAEQGKF